MARTRTGRGPPAGRPSQRPGSAWSARNHPAICPRQLPVRRPAARPWRPAPSRPAGPRAPGSEIGQQRERGDQRVERQAGIRRGVGQATAAAAATIHLVAGPRAPARITRQTASEKRNTDIASEVANTSRCIRRCCFLARTCFPRPGGSGMRDRPLSFARVFLRYRWIWFADGAGGSPGARLVAGKLGHQQGPRCQRRT
jgi:hypothetical protein